MKFEWDPRKAESNLRKHGVSFDEAGSVFLDRLALSGPDPDHSISDSAVYYILTEQTTRITRRSTRIRRKAARTA